MNMFNELTEWEQKSINVFLHRQIKFALVNAKVLLLFVLPIMYSCNKDSGLLEQLGEFESLYPVQYGEKWGYIDSDGQLNINPIFQFDADGFNNMFLNGSAVASIDGKKYGFIDTDGNFIISPLYNQAASFSKIGLAWVQNGDDQYFIDKSGMPKIMLTQYEWAGWFFSDGLTEVYNEDWEVGYIDTDGKLVIPPIFYDGNSFNNGLAWVKRKSDAKYEAIDKTGKTTVSAMFDNAYEFREGLASVRIGDYYGYINTKGEYKISLQFDWADSFYEGLACVEQNGKYGYINKKGEWEIMAQFDDALEFCGGYAAVEMKGKWGFIDKKGNWTVQPIFFDAFYFIADLAFVYYSEDDEGFSYVDKKGSIVWKHTNLKSMLLRQKEVKSRTDKSEIRRMIYDQLGY